MSTFIVFLVSWITIIGYYFNIPFAFVLGWGMHCLSIIVSLIVLNSWDNSERLRSAFRKSLLANPWFILFSWVTVNIPAIVVLTLTVSYNTLGVVVLSYLISIVLTHKVMNLKKEKN